MAKHVPSFAELIEKDRATRDTLEWKGNFLEYLEKVKAEPKFAKLAHARLYDVVLSEGSS